LTSAFLTVTGDASVSSTFMFDASICTLEVIYKV
jgi:hypothetical protein